MKTQPGEKGRPVCRVKKILKQIGHRRGVVSYLLGEVVVRMHVLVSHFAGIVPFVMEPEKMGVVPGPGQDTGKTHFRVALHVLPTVGQFHQPMVLRILPGQQTGTAGTALRGNREHLPEQHTLGCQGVDVGGDRGMPVTAGASAGVVGDDKNNIPGFIHSFFVIGFLVNGRPNASGCKGFLPSDILIVTSMLNSYGIFSSRQTSSPWWRMAVVLMLLGGLPGCSSLGPAAGEGTFPDPPRTFVQKAGVLPGVQADPADPAWASAAPLRLGRARGSKPLGEPTDVRLLWSPEFLFVRFVSLGDTWIVPHSGERDLELFRGDVVEVFLDVVGDSRQWVELQVSPKGDLTDIRIRLTAPPDFLEDGRLSEKVYPSEYHADWDWNLEEIQWASRLLETGEGNDLWIVDLALPARAFFEEMEDSLWQKEMVLRAHFVRYERRSPQGPPIHHSWNPRVPRGNPHRTPGLMGTLELR